MLETTGDPEHPDREGFAEMTEQPFDPADMGADIRKLIEKPVAKAA